MKKQYISDIKIGMQIDDVFVIVEKNIGTKRDGNFFAKIKLADKSGQLEGVMWNYVERMFLNVKLGDFVIVRASVGEYRGNPQLIIKNIILADEDSLNFCDFLASTDKNIDQMFDHLKSITKKFNNIYLKKLFEEFWSDEYFVKQFKLAPAAKHIHHAYIGGLLEHTLSMVILAQKISKHYGGNIDEDLFLSGVILHDVGKVKELSYSNNINYTDEGLLLSHIVIGVSMVEEKIKNISDFPNLTAYLLKHLIVSHHGSKEFGSPEVPKMMEAVLLNCIDEMDFRVNTIANHIASDKSGGSWTVYNRIMERQFYKGPVKIEL